MKNWNRSLWSKLTDVRRAKVIALLVQILLRQLAKERGDK